MGDAEPKRRGRPKGNRGTRRTLNSPSVKMMDALKAKLDLREGCWVYRAKPTAGHGTFCFNGDIMGSAHRVAYQLWKGEIPQGGYVLQTCLNKLCCNPEHLQLGTFSDVMQRRDAAGKNIRGMRNPKAKLTREQVETIRTRVLSGEKPKVLSDEFGVSQSTISQIKSGNIWKPVD